MLLKSQCAAQKDMSNKCLQCLSEVRVSLSSICCCSSVKCYLHIPFQKLAHQTVLIGSSSDILSNNDLHQILIKKKELLWRAFSKVVNRQLIRRTIRISWCTLQLKRNAFPLSQLLGLRVLQQDHWHNVPLGCGHLLHRNLHGDTLVSPSNSQNEIPGEC